MSMTNLKLNIGNDVP